LKREKEMGRGSRERKEKWEVDRKAGFKMEVGSGVLLMR
jgi:hypothetical protein